MTLAAGVVFILESEHEIYLLKYNESNLTIFDIILTKLL